MELGERKGAKLEPVALEASFMSFSLLSYPNFLSCSFFLFSFPFLSPRFLYGSSRYHQYPKG
jgi:hypothetical protein